MRTLLFLLLVCCVYAQTTINYTGNVTLKGDKDSWNYRKTDMTTWDGSPWVGADFKSISVGGTEWSREGDAMWGEAYVQPSNAPTAWVAYAEWGVYNESNTINVAGAKSYMANEYSALVEMCPNKTVARAQSLKEGWFGTGVQWTATNKGENGELKYVSFTGQKQGEPWSIVITWIVSDVVGKVDMANATVTPKSLESIVHIQNWPYQSNENTLTLVMVVATGKSVAKGNVMISGSDASQVYCSVSSQATVEGVKKNVAVSSWMDGNMTMAFNDSNIQGNLNTMYGKACDIKVVEVSFPAGAQDILYDPTLGAGAVAEEEESGNAATSTTASVMLVFIALFALLFV